MQATFTQQLLNSEPLQWSRVSFWKDSLSKLQAEKHTLVKERGVWRLRERERRQKAHHLTAQSNPPFLRCSKWPLCPTDHAAKHKSQFSFWYQDLFSIQRCQPADQPAASERLFICLVKEIMKIRSKDGEKQTHNSFQNVANYCFIFEKQKETMTDVLRPYLSSDCLQQRK